MGGSISESGRSIPQTLADLVSQAWARVLADAGAAADVFLGEDWGRQRILADSRLGVFDEALWRGVEIVRETDPGDWSLIRTEVCGICGPVPNLIVETFCEVVRARGGFGWENDFTIAGDRGESSREWLAANLFRFSLDRSGLRDLLRRVWETHGWQDDPDAVIGREGEAFFRWVDAAVREFGFVSKKWIHMYRRLFFRNQHAYLVGSLESGSGESVPVAIALTRSAGTTSIDGFVIGEDALLRIFEFSRSYVFVADPDFESLALWLARLMPRKDFPQLVINLGFPDAGRQLIRGGVEQIARMGGLRFRRAQGVRGMVMIVFTDDRLNVVFKVIRSRIRPPKETSLSKVLERYRFVSRQDRVGRVADAQLHHNWVFDPDQFDPELLEELRTEAADLVSLEGGRVLLRKVITERKLCPLDLYLRGCDATTQERMVVEYGDAIRDLARSNFFPGDLLVKNFGVTSEGRVVFYDYDEVCRVTDCAFRKLPEPKDDDEAWDQEVRMVVREGDIFPEEMPTFLFPAGALRDALLRHHGDLFTPDFWNQWKAFHLAGRFVDRIPFERYPWRRSESVGKLETGRTG